VWLLNQCGSVALIFESNEKEKEMARNPSRIGKVFNSATDAVVEVSQSPKLISESVNNTLKIANESLRSSLVESRSEYLETLQEYNIRYCGKLNRKDIEKIDTEKNKYQRCKQ